MSTNLPSASNDPTPTYFNGYYDTPLRVSANVYDVILSEFKKVMQDSVAAESLTSALLSIASSQQKDPLELMNAIVKDDRVSVTQAMAILLNSTRQNTSLIGFKQPAKTNQFAARNIYP